MARNRKDMSRALFDRLARHAELLDDPISHREGVRYIKRQDEPDAELMAAGKATALVVTRQIRLVRIEHDGQLYFCAFGLPEPDQAIAGLDVVPLTPGIFAVSILQAGVHPGRSVTAAMVKDVLDDSYLDNGLGYEGHDLDQIASLFPVATVYRAVETLKYHSSIERVLGSILARTYVDGPISLEQDTVELLVEMFESDSDLIPFRNLIQGILSISWENLFVEIYRCVEQMYALPRVDKLRNAILYGQPIRDLAILLESHLSWYPKEEEAFRTLVLMCEETTISTLCTGLEACNGDTHVKRCEKAARELYEIRNRIVHYRPAHDTIEKLDSDWNIIVRGMLGIVAFLYNTKGAIFFGGAPVADA